MRVDSGLAALAIIVFIFKYDDLLWPLVVAQRAEIYPLPLAGWCMPASFLSKITSSRQL